MKHVHAVMSLMWLCLATVPPGESEYFKKVRVKRKMHLLWNSRNASTNLRCAATCVSDTLCAAHVYDATTSTCQGYLSAIQHEIVQSTRAKHGYVVYYSQTRARGTKRGATPSTQSRGATGARGTRKGATPSTRSRGAAGSVGIYQRCKGTRDCRVTKSRCSRGICKCPSGFNYLRRTKVCTRSAGGTRGRAPYPSHPHSASGAGGTRGRAPYPSHPHSASGAGGTRGRAPYPYQPDSVRGSRGVNWRPPSASQPYGAPGTGDIDQLCKWNSLCHVTNSVCLNGYCKCTPGFSFDRRMHACVRRCRQYGSTVSIYKHFAIKGHNDRQVKARSPEQCGHMCALETSFRCLSFDFKHNFGCFLSTSGYLDVDKSYQERNQIDWVFGTRNCA